MKERWKDIPGYQGEYQASDRGRIRSIDHYVRGVHRNGVEFYRLSPGKILRPGTCDKFGHVSVALRRNNSQMVHSIIARTFIGPRPKNQDVAHKNGKGADNRLCNLKYKTRSKNNRDILYHGRRMLTLAQVKRIKRTKTYTDACVLADRFGISYSHSYNIMRENATSYLHIRP